MALKSNEQNRAPKHPIGRFEQAVAHGAPGHAVLKWIVVRRGPVNGVFLAFMRIGRARAQ